LTGVRVGFGRSTAQVHRDEEEKTAEYIGEHVTKPVLAYIAGFTPPPGKTMGHVGAILSGTSGTAQAAPTRSRPSASVSAARRRRSPSWPSRPSARPTRRCLIPRYGES
jgi:hypothetical protein